MKKWLKVTFFVVGGILLLVVLLSLMAGPLVKRYAEKHSVELCHRVANMDKVRINLFNGTVSIDALNVLEEDGKSSFLSFNKLKVNASLMKLMAKEVKITGIYLDGLDAKVVQDGSRFNFSDIIELYTKKPKKEKDDKPSQWAVNLMDIQIHNSSIQYRDAQIGSRFGLNNLDLVIPQLYLAGGRSDISLDLDFDEGGDLALKLLYDIQKGDYNLGVKMSKFNIQALKPYLDNTFAIATCQGLLTGDIAVKGSLQHIMNMVASGKVSLDGVHITNAANQPLLSLGNLNLDLEKADLQNNNYIVNHVSVKNMNFNYDMYKDGNTLSRLMKARSTDATTKDTSSSEAVSKELHYWVKKVDISGGEILYRDHTLSQPMSFPVRQLVLKVRDLKNAESADVDLSATLGQSGRLKCAGSINPMDLKNGTLKVDIENLAINSFSPYSVYYLAYPIEDGLLSFHSDNVIKENWLTSKNNLDIYKPTFGNKLKGEQPKANIPMKAAMYLITDRKGHVQMDLPVSGDLSSPSFSFRKVIWKTFTNLLVKVMLSPVDFLSNLAGDNAFKDMTIPVAPNLQLSMEQCHQLNEISNVLKEKEHMDLIVRVGCSLSGDETSDMESKVLENRRNAYTLVCNYLQQQGVESSRVKMDESADVNVKPDNVKIKFNVEIPE